MYFYNEFLTEFVKLSVGNINTLLMDISYVQTVPNHRRLLIIDDKSLPHKQR